MRWLALIAAGLLVSCSALQEHAARPPKTPVATAPPSMMNKAEAVQDLKNEGYTSAALVPSQTAIGGWSGTAMKDGVKEHVTVEKNGMIE